MERLLILFFMSCLNLHTARTSQNGQTDVIPPPGMRLKFLDNLLRHRQVVEPLSFRPGKLDLPPQWKSLPLGSYNPLFEKRSIADREKKEKELADILQNLIDDLDSEKARLPGRGSFNSISGESSGELLHGSTRDFGAKRKYGNIFRGPMQLIPRTPPRPRRQRKLRVDPIMFWMGIGK